MANLLRRVFIDLNKQTDSYSFDYICTICTTDKPPLSSKNTANTLLTVIADTTVIF